MFYDNGIVEEHILVEHLFQCGGEYTQDVQQWFQVQLLQAKLQCSAAVDSEILENRFMCFQTRLYVCVMLLDMIYITTAKGENVGYLRVYALKSEDVYWEIIPAGSCLLWHSPYCYKKCLDLHAYKIKAGAWI